MMRVFLVMFLVSLHINAFGQQRTLTGTVTDESGLPLPGVTVAVENTTKGTITDANGNYTIDLQEGENSLVFSFIGFESQTIDVSGQTSLDVTLKEAVLGIDEVVVVGYGTVKKSDLTGAVGKVGGEELNAMATADPVQNLQGKLAGVNVVSNSGEPGSGTRIRVRGIGTINNSDPLYVVDGFPMNNMSNVDPSNIESVEVLKDASATAIYGSRGANGVVLVTTKSGKEGKARFDVNSYAGVQVINERIDMANGYEFAELRKEAYENAGLTVPKVEMLDYVINNQLEGTDWQEELFNVAPIQNYSLSVSGGTESVNYNVGGTYNSQEGTIDNSGIDKLFLYSNTQYNFSEKVSLGANLSYTFYEKNNNNNNQYGGSLTDGLQMDPLTAAWDDYTNNYGKRFITGGTTIANPARIVDEAEHNTSSAHRLIANFDLNIKDVFIEGLAFKTMYAADIHLGKSKAYYPEFYIAPDQKRDKSSLYEQRFEQMDWVWNGYFSYNKDLGTHSVNTTLGAETQSFNYNAINATAFDVPFDEDLMYFDQAQDPEQKTVNGGAGKTTLMSYFARANYSFDNRYLLTATYRADGSSKFVGDNQWGYFPSFSMGWNVTEESFMSDVYFFDQLKFRAGWGQVGNEASVAANSYLATMNTGYTYVFGNSPVDGARAGALSNPDLKWEVTEQLNVGVDMMFLDQRLSASIDWFDRDTKDMILRTPIPYYVGSGRPARNAGTMNNTGIEASLTWNENKEDFQYSISLNASSIKNEVTSLAGGEPISGGNAQKMGSVTRTEEGHEIAYFYGLETDGIFNNESELNNYTWTDPESGSTKAIQPSAGLGDLKFVDQNNDGVINEDDRVKLGSAIPDFTAGLNLQMAYKGFDFKAFFYGVFGSEAVNVLKYYTHGSFSQSNYHTDKMNRWTPDNPDTNEPRVISTDPNQNSRFSDRHVEDNSYIRLRNLQIGYTLDEGFVESIGLGSVRFYLNGDNLMTITDYSGYNPEIAGGGDLSNGVDFATYPMGVTLTGGVNIKF
ncbi:SusC/RagA family TonB-linked outer membrane protein [Marinilabilia rubra]|nr:TonB-dependent receptor [Marinilabilia rubra]